MAEPSMAAHRVEVATTGRVITIPAFAAGQRLSHFFGTRPPQATGDRSDGQAGGGGDDRPRPGTVVSVKQVHGTDVLVLDGPVPPHAAAPVGFDALVTNQVGVLLTVTTADCVPVLLQDPVQHVVAAIHAGWRGAVDGIVPKTLATMASAFGTRPETVRLAVGPSAGPCCYEVDAAVLTPLQQRYPYWRQLVRETGAERAFLDLRGLVIRQAQAAGVCRDMMWTVNLCTICHPGLFYSYRREGRVKGTMVSGIMLPTECRRQDRPTPTR